MSRLIRLREALCGLESEISRHQARLSHRCQLADNDDFSQHAKLRLAHIRQVIREFLNSGEALVLAIHLRLDESQFAHLSPRHCDQKFHPTLAAKSDWDSAEDAEYLCDRVRAILCNWEAKLRFTPARIAIHHILAELEVTDSAIKANLLPLPPKRGQEPNWQFR